MKKQILLLSIAMSLASCATKPTPKNACVLNYKSKISDHLSQEIKFKGNHVEHYSQQHCAHFDFLFCTVKGELKDRDVILDYPGLFGSKGKVATLDVKDGNVKYEKSFLDKFVKTQNLEIDMEQRKASFERHAGMHKTVFGEEMGISRYEIEIGKKCTYKEAALGAVLFSKTLTL